MHKKMSSTILVLEIGSPQGQSSSGNIAQTNSRVYKLNIIIYIEQT